MQLIDLQRVSLGAQYQLGKDARLVWSTHDTSHGTREERPRDDMTTASDASITPASGPWRGSECAEQPGEHARAQFSDAEAFVVKRWTAHRIEIVVRSITTDPWTCERVGERQERRMDATQETRDKGAVPSAEDYPRRIPRPLVQLNAPALPRVHCAARSQQWRWK